MKFYIYLLCTLLLKSLPFQNIIRIRHHNSLALYFSFSALYFLPLIFHVSLSFHSFLFGG